MPKVLRTVRPDEGTASPYVARLWVGIFELRNAILSDPEDVHQFDCRYEPVVKALDKARESAREIRLLVADHYHAVRQRRAVEIYPNGQITVHIQVNETLNRRFDSFMVFAHRAMKLTQHLVKEFADVDVGFLFKKSLNFSHGCDAL